MYACKGFTNYIIANKCIPIGSENANLNEWKIFQPGLIAKNLLYISFKTELMLFQALYNIGIRSPSQLLRDGYANVNGEDYSVVQLIRDDSMLGKLDFILFF